MRRITSRHSEEQVVARFLAPVRPGDILSEERKSAAIVAVIWRVIWSQKGRELKERKTGGDREQGIQLATLATKCASDIAVELDPFVYRRPMPGMASVM